MQKYYDTLLWNMLVFCVSKVYTAVSKQLHITSSAIWKKRPWGVNLYTISRCCILHSWSMYSRVTYKITKHKVLTIPLIFLTLSSISIKFTSPWPKKNEIGTVFDEFMVLPAAQYSAQYLIRYFCILFKALSDHRSTN